MYFFPTVHVITVKKKVREFKFLVVFHSVKQIIKVANQLRVVLGRGTTAQEVFTRGLGSTWIKNVGVTEIVLIIYRFMVEVMWRFQ